MQAAVETLNAWSNVWASILFAGVWQSTLLFAIVAVVAIGARRAPPAARYWLWQIVAIKLLVIPAWSWSLSVPWLEADQAPAHRAHESSRDARPATPLVAWPAVDAADSTPVADDRLPSERLNWRGWLLLGWLVAVAGQVLLIVTQRRRLRRLLRHAAIAGDGLVGQVRAVAAELKIRPPRVLLTDADYCPFVCGLWRSTLVLPGELAASLPAERLRQVVVHELAHLKRRDLVWGWIPEIARLLYFFHPVAYWTARRARFERELACDQLAMAVCGRGPAEYAETLVQVVSTVSTPSLLRAGLTAGISTMREVL